MPEIDEFMGSVKSRKLTNVITCKPFYLQRDDNDDRPIT